MSRLDITPALRRAGVGSDWPIGVLGAAVLAGLLLALVLS